LAEAVTGKDRQPRVSVVMPACNAERYLREAVESILAQTFDDFEFVVVDDGSTDRTWTLLRSYRDARMRCCRNDENAGVTRSLNRGVAAARGDYIARQDADDVSRPSRLETQVAYLEAHPEVGILGSAYQVIDAEGRPRGLGRPPESDTEIRWQTLFHSAFCHSAVMLRREALAGIKGPYDEAAVYAEDYDLWAKLVRRTKAANLPQLLVRHRVHGNSIGSTRRQEQYCSATGVAARQIRELLPDYSLTECDIAALRGWYAHLPRRWGSKEAELCRTLLQLLAAFGRQRIADPEVVRQLRGRWLARILGTVLTRQPGLLRESGVLEAMRLGDVVPVVTELARTGWRRARQ
jgi:hypothetical protein